MCLKESFCPFTRGALNFRPPKIYAAPHHRAVFRFALSLSRHHCAVLSFYSVTAHAHRKSRVCSNIAPKKSVYVMLVYLLLFAVALLCYKISFTDLLPAMFSSHSLIIHVYLMFLYTESSFLFISHWFTRSDEHYYAIIPLYVWMTETRVFLYNTHTLKCAWRINEDINTRRTSPERVTLWVLHRFIWVTLSPYHIHTEM